LAVRLLTALLVGKEETKSMAEMATTAFGAKGEHTELCSNRIGVGRPYAITKSNETRPTRRVKCAVR
jgi:hypothetical protein